MARTLCILFGLIVASHHAIAAADIPRPEHPTPDAVRPHWANLNGPWGFQFDPKDEGRAGEWFKPKSAGYDQKIVVPFPWESELSGVKRPDYHGIAWYRREFTVPADFPKNHHVWLHFGAVDWEADVWVNGTHVARHEGGYTPFEADITEALKLTAWQAADVIVRVYDPTDPSLPTGKQVGWYTSTSGIWQTVWLEARPQFPIRDFSIRPELIFDPELVAASANFSIRSKDTPATYTFAVRPDDPTVEAEAASTAVKDGITTAKIRCRVKSPKLWTPETPHLYDVTIELKDKEGQVVDSIKTYFGLRTITRGKYGDAPYERILLNGKPVYLRTALDQSFNPKGIYTAPDDDFLKRDLLIARENGLNGLRIHIKPDEPRRLYWADKIGLLILEDMPNTWRQNARARASWEATMREVVARDQNHPCIVAWIAFNETWGLVSGSSELYKKDTDTQQWVNSMVSAIRKLDPTRLVEDQSPCNYDHIENTDFNSWHFYIDDHAEAKRHIDEVVAKTEKGSTFNYCPGQKQGTAPLINSEYGGVGAGDGDRDVSWCFRDLTTLLRHQPKIQGYVYTELADIEWEHNGFVNYDRSLKTFAYDQFLPDLRPFELNGADFVGYGGPPCIVAKPGEMVSVPVFISHFSDRIGQPTLRWWVDGWDTAGNTKVIAKPTNRPASWKPYDVVDLEPVTFRAPDRPFMGSVLLTVRDENNQRIAANYVNLVVKAEAPAPRVQRVDNLEAVLRFEPGDFSRSQWSGPSASVPGKVWGQGKGGFEYALKIPPAIVRSKPTTFFLRMEAGSKAGRAKVDWPSRVSPRDYPQTDAKTWPSTVELTLNGKPIAREDLDDDFADALGVYSHLSKRDPGSHGQQVEFAGDLPDSVKYDIASGKPLILRLQVPDDAKPAGGLCIFAAETGRYPFGISLSLRTELVLPTDLEARPNDSIAIDRRSDRILKPLAAGDMEAPSTWSYTTTDPGPGWEAPGFDASSWKQGKAGFGTAPTPAIRSNTRWKTDRIWLRTSVTLPKIGAGDVLVLHEFHDEDVEVFVNGKPLMKATGYLSAYRDLTLDTAQKALFQVGQNVMAVSCRQTGGGQGIDIGLTLELAEGPKPAKP